LSAGWDLDEHVIEPEGLSLVLSGTIALESMKAIA
jgi:hypothetical protein